MAISTRPGSRQGANSVQVRRFNERVVLEALQQRGEASKAELARSAKLTPQAVAAIVDHLAQVGLVRHVGKRNGGVGQPSTLYAPDPEGAFSIGLHIGRRALDAVLVDFTGAVIRIDSTEYDYPEPVYVCELAAAYVRTLQGDLATRLRDRLVGVGVAVPHFMFAWAQDLEISAGVAEAWRDFPFAKTLETHIAQPLFFENDGSGAATAELVYGHGKTTRDFLYLFISTFIGGGLVLNGNLETGPSGNTAAFGPMPVTPSLLDTVPRPSGAFELLLRRASVHVLMRHLRHHGVSINRAKDLTELGEDAEPYLSEWILDCADALAQAIVSALCVIDVSAIVIDGILPPAILLRTVAALTERLRAILPQGVVAPKIVSGALGARAAAIGAATLPLYSFFAPDRAALLRVKGPEAYDRNRRLQSYIADIR